MKATYVRIALCDPLNPGCGFQVNIDDQYGEQLLATTVNPMTGADLDTFDKCVDVVNLYRHG